MSIYTATLEQTLRPVHWARRQLASSLVRLKPQSQICLTDLANLYKSDKGDLWHSRHNYTEVYNEIFAKYRHEEINILEIGLRHDPFYFLPGMHKCPSLQMWEGYFTKANIYGFDIKDLTAFSSDRKRIVQGDQGKLLDLERIAATCNGFSIIIDDGSHASYHQRLTLETLLPCVSRGGLFVIEDLHWQPEDLEMELPSTPKMIDLLRDASYLNNLGVSANQVDFHCDDKMSVIRQVAN